jgi:hypothetical protein
MSLIGGVITGEDNSEESGSDDFLIVTMPDGKRYKITAWAEYAADWGLSVEEISNVGGA